MSTEGELRSQNERLELLLNLTSKITSSLNLREVLRAISANIREVIHSDGVTVSLPDAASGKMREVNFSIADHPRTERMGMRSDVICYRIFPVTAGFVMPCEKAHPAVVSPAWSWTKTRGLPRLRRRR
jgi:hypothetical protein